MSVRGRDGEGLGQGCAYFLAYGTGVGGWVGGYEGKKRSLSWGPGKFFRLTVDRCNSSVNKCLVVTPLNADASWGHNFARQSRV